MVCRTHVPPSPLFFGPCSPLPLPSEIMVVSYLPFPFPFTGLYTAGDYSKFGLVVIVANLVMRVGHPVVVFLPKGFQGTSVAPQPHNVPYARLLQPATCIVSSAFGFLGSQLHIIFLCLCVSLRINSASGKVKERDVRDAPYFLHSCQILVHLPPELSGW